jgi:hypothetical protein
MKQCFVSKPLNFTFKFWSKFSRYVLEKVTQKSLLQKFCCRKSCRSLSHIFVTSYCLLCYRIHQNLLLVTEVLLITVQMQYKNVRVAFRVTTRKHIVTKKYINGSKIMETTHTLIWRRRTRWYWDNTHVDMETTHTFIRYNKSTWL